MPVTRAVRANTRPSFVPEPEVLRARRLLLGLYGLLGLTVASWLSRLPSVRDALSLTTGELGTVLLVGAVGSLLTVLVAGSLVERWGSRRVLLAAAVVFSSANLLLGLGPTIGSTPVLVAGVAMMSASFALGNVPMNVESAVIERRMRRTVVPQFHATFSIGSVAGSGLGALAAWGQVPLLVHFGAISLLALVWRFAAVPGAVLPVAARPAPLVTDEPVRRGARLRTAMVAWREKRTLLIGVIVLTAALSEGSANSWLAIGVVDGFARSEAVAAVVFGVFVASMTTSRFLGPHLIDRYGRVPVLGTSGMVSLAGLVLFGTAGSLPLAVLGVVGWGLGAGLAIPIGMVAVSEDPMRAAGRVAVVSAFASVASIAAPPLLGYAAESMGVRHALLLIGVGMVVSTVLAGQVRPTSEADADAEPAAPAPAAPEPAGPGVAVPRADAPVTDDDDDAAGSFVVPDTVAEIERESSGVA
jgi:MFS family permease